MLGLEALERQGVDLSGLLSRGARQVVGLLHGVLAAFPVRHDVGDLTQDSLGPGRLRHPRGGELLLRARQEGDAVRRLRRARVLLRGVLLRRSQRGHRSQGRQGGRGELRGQHREALVLVAEHPHAAQGLVIHPGPGGLRPRVVRAHAHVHVDGPLLVTVRRHHPSLSGQEGAPLGHTHGGVGHGGLQVHDAVVDHLRRAQVELRSLGRVQRDVAEAAGAAVGLSHGHAIQDSAADREVVPELLRSRAPRDASDEELRRADVDVRAGPKRPRHCSGNSRHRPHSTFGGEGSGCLAEAATQQKR
mmetsp:Transcript_2558/g.7679  ORF Transcript_2558/g.7679 Transcript_2558/m.7679 type:complete len:303 (+) Transcript_2558:995-1903(+)